ncbi:hypothetical protein [Pontibacter vulgaris]|uniref:hypothetical protein n=1 Tax=Pontibacter vulgaris TaxID=2905679 RepID=UPI001FA78E71|nr:hypothetical protein [Pontibacter vulgaris]
MPKRILLYLLGFVVLASLAYYGYSRWQSAREKVDLWTLVPEDAAFVIETNNHSALVKHLRGTGLWDSFSTLPVVQRFEENILWLDSIAPGNQRLERFLNKKEILTSVHVVGKTDLEFVYYVPVNTVGEHRFLRTLTENLSKSEFFKEESRNYEGVLLTDITNASLGTSFTYFTHHNNIILSASPVLIEAIVRRIKRGEPVSIAAEFKHTNYLSQPDVYANIYVNYRELPSVLALFLQDDIMPQVRYLSSLCRNAMLELKLESNKIFLNGFSNPEELKSSLHNRMQPAAPKPLLVKNYLPARTAALLHFGVNQVARLHNPAKAAGTVYAATLDSLAASIKQEVAIAYLEAYNIKSKPEKIVFARMAKPARTASLLAQLNKQVSNANKIRPHSERYGSYTLQQVNVTELPSQLFGELFTGFEQSYVVQIDDYLLFASEVATLRSLLDDIATDNVWGKSVQQKAFLDETLHESNFSLYLNTVNAWYILSRYMTDESREDLLQHATLIKRFNQISFQFARADEQYYTSFVFRSQDRSNTTKDEFAVEVALPFSSRLDSKPYPVQSAVDRSSEVVVQDSANILHNISAVGKPGWTDTLSSSIRGGIQQIEFGPDKKLRYVFATANRIHAIDNQGQDAENFPFNVGDSLNIQQLSVFDYEKNGNYRLLVDDYLGNLYMYDIRGNAIDGWSPRRMDYRLAAAPQHLRVGGRDVILVLLENGYVYALDKQGETYPGFPFSLRSPVTSGVLVKPGADFKKSEITTVTKYGEVVVFNLLGRVLKREQLLRPTKRAMFEMVAENAGKSFVIVRQDEGRVTVFDQDLKELFEKRYVTSAPKIVQYFHFGGDRKVYAITETGPQKTYLYDAKGTLIGNHTLDNNQPVTIFYNDVANSYTLYKVYRNELKKLSFKLPNK